jgi:proline iminopeptidase
MFVRVRDVRLFFDVEGSKLAPEGPVMREKPTLLCLHGGPGLDHSAFRPGLSPLADMAQVVYLDQRGHGRSERSEPARWSLAEWADDVVAFCEILKIEQPIVLGSSFGGYVAMAYAIRHPDHASKLILISTSARGTGNRERRGNVLAAFERRGGVAAREAVRRAFDHRTREAYDEYGRVCGPLYSRLPPEPSALARTVRSPEVLPYFERFGGEGVTFDLSEQLSRIHSRTLVLAGEEDPITPVAELEHIVACMIPGRARLVRFAGCGHGVLRDNPDGLLDEVRKFVAESASTL